MVSPTECQLPELPAVVSLKPMPDDQEPADRYEKPGFGNDPQFASLREHFIEAFGSDDADDNPHNDAAINVLHAPGRVNLIGEHIDYNDGFVFPMAIRPRLTFAFRRRVDGQIRLQSEQYGDSEITFAIDDAAPGDPKWTNYIRGPITLLRQQGAVLTGMDCLIIASLPQGAGLSSSAALEVGTTVAMLHLSGGEMSPVEIAQLCQRAENEIVGMPCGIMDQTIVAGGREGHAMMLDCRSMEMTHVPLPPDELAVIVCDSKVSHELTDGGYKKRREQCEKVAGVLGVKALRDADMGALERVKDQLDDSDFRRARHAISEIARVPRFAAALEAKDYEASGRLMYESHESLRDDYDVSTDELNHLVETARGQDGVYGSRMTGAGFGGCTVTLCRPDAADDVRSALAGAVQERFGIETLPFVTPASAGARVVD